MVAGLLATLAALRPLVGSELRYMLASREMLTGGDWVVPHLGGVPYMEKPILFYWISAGAQWLLGTSPAAARAPSILGFVALAVVTFALATEWRGRTFGVAAAALLAASGAVLILGTSLTTDPLFAGTLAIAWYALWRHRVSPESRWKWMFWFGLAAATLTKGPLGGALVVASCGVLVVAERRVRWLVHLRPVAGGALLLVLCAPWHAALWLGDPRLLEFFYVRQNARALVDAHINHAGPVWYYLPVLLMLAFPWSALLFHAVGGGLVALRGGRAHPADGPAGLHGFVAACLLGPLVLLSLASSKLGTYLLPLTPFVALLLTRAAERALERGGALLRVATAAPLLVLIPAAWIAGPQVLRRYDVSRFSAGYLPFLVVTGSVLFGCLAIGAVLGWRRRVAALPLIGAGVLAAVLLAGFAGIDPAARLDARALAGAVGTERREGDAVVVASRLAQDYSIPLALGGHLLLLGRAREMGMGHFVDFAPADMPIPDAPYDVRSADLPGDPGLVDYRELRALWSGTGRVWLFGKDKDVAPLRAVGLTVHVARDDGRVVVYTNRVVPGPR